MYDFKDAAIVRAIGSALGLPQVRVEDSGNVEQVLAAANGIAIADALHVAGTPVDARAFVTFDKQLARRVRSSLGPIKTL